MSEAGLMPSPTQSKPNSPSAQVFAVYGAEPEVQAYAMAKYSRSALSMKESLQEISQQKAEKFLNTFYFQYGHRSIADLAHIALAVERLSILAAIVIADEQRLMARSARRVIRISARAATTRRISRTILPRTIGIAKPSPACLRVMKRSRSRPFATSQKLRR